MSLLDDALANTANLHTRVLSCRLAAYRELLAAHDWSFEFSDDPAVRAQGRAQRHDLYAMKRELDVDGHVWNEYAPEGFQQEPL